MISALADLEGSALDADVCVVGAGPVGLTVAHELESTGMRVVVAESGGLARDAAADRLNAGFTEGLPPERLLVSRVRAFGGTSKAWPGGCMRFDDDDLAGWPVSAAELLPYYRRAEALLGLAPGALDVHPWERFGLRAPSSPLGSRFVALAPRKDVGRTMRRPLCRSRNVRVLLGATATSVRDGEVELAVGARRVAVSAPAVVLAAGAIENARLLLASGLGGDAVGTTFANHPAMWCGEIESDRPRRLQELFGVHYLRRTRLNVRLELPARLGAPALAGLVFRSGHEPALDAAKRLLRRRGGRRDVARAARGAPWVAAALGAQASRGRIREPLARSIALICVAEQPLASGRVRLADECDELGVRKPVLSWTVREEEHRTLQTLTHAVGDALQAEGLGRVVPAPALANGDWREHVFDTFHHLGTTPIGRATDDHGLVDGTRGVFAAGGSIFPRAGAGNPTLTMMALAARLADRLCA